jgi:MinD-like ATPase involved in chromosome partitioning or flagellar assembly
MWRRAVAEPEVALVFTPEQWVEELHRHLTDHGGARVRQIVVEPEVALEESYDVLIASHRWPALTHAFVGQVHARGRAVLGVFDREEPAARGHLVSVGVDEVIESDCGPDAFVERLVALHARRAAAPAPVAPQALPSRRGRVVVVGGPAGAGRTEISVHLAAGIADVLVDADDVAPSIAPRLGLSIEPNLRTAIDAVEHGRGELAGSLVPGPGTCSVLAGLPNANGWAHVRVGEVMRVIEDLASEPAAIVVVDSGGPIEDVGGSPRGRHAVARALLLEADVIIAVCPATPVGITRFLSWIVEVRRIAPFVPVVVAVNRAPASRFRRGEIYEELTRSLPPFPIEFVADDRRVSEAAWDGRLARKGSFTRAVARLGAAVAAMPRAKDGWGEVDEVIEALERAS